MIANEIGSIYVPPGSVEEVPERKRGKVKRVLKVALKALQKGRGLTLMNGDTINNVYEVRHLGRVVGYLKFGGAGNEASSILERIAWKVALIVGYSEYFTATIPLIFRNPQEISLEFPTGSKGERGEKVVGTLQPKRKGVDIDEYAEGLGNKWNASSTDLMRATVAALIFGMWDWHGGNGVLSKKGKPKFFDNGRFLPNENSLMSIQGLIQTPFYFALMYLPHFYKRFSNKNRDFLLEEVRGVLKELPRVREYFEGGEVKELLDEIPKGWIDSEKAIDAMKERMIKMEKALVDKRVVSLHALVCQVIPYYRFFAALVVIALADEVDEAPLKDVLRVVMGNAGHYDLNSLLELCCNRGINPETILKESLNEDIPLSVLVMKVLQRVTASNRNKADEGEIKETRWNAIQIIKRFTEESHEELKDLGECKIQSQIHGIVVNKAERLNLYSLPAIQDSMERALFSNSHPLEIAIKKVWETRRFGYRLAYRDHDGEKMFKDVTFYYPNYFEVVGEEESPPKLLHEILGEIYPGYYFPNCYSRYQASRYLRGGHKWLLGTGKNKGTYYVYYTAGNGVKKFEYFQSKEQPGKFIDKVGRVYTLNQLEKDWSWTYKKVVRKDATSLELFR